MDKICSICHDTENLITEENMLVSEKCKHIFHGKCYATYYYTRYRTSSDTDMNVNLHKICPFCKTQQPIESIEEIPNWNVFKKHFESDYFYYEFRHLSRHFNLKYGDCMIYIDGKYNISYNNDLFDWDKIEEKLTNTKYLPREFNNLCYDHITPKYKEMQHIECVYKVQDGMSGLRYSA